MNIKKPYISAMKQSNEIIQRVLFTFNQKFPAWMDQVVNPYLAELGFPSVHAQSVNHVTDQRLQFNFSALLGETQQGKTLVMHLITWIMTYVYGLTPCYITKKLAALRDDAMDKLNCGLVNTIVDQVCTELDCPMLAPKFKLRGKVGLHVASKGVSAGEVPVFLMQPENNLKVLQWMRRVKANSCYPVFFIDEVHELYPIKDYLKTQGLTPNHLEKGRVHNHALIHMIAQTCKALGCGMLGITATPHRMLTSDPEVFPSKLFSIPCHPPKPGLVRIGYADDSDEFKGATFHPETNVVSVVNKVLQRPPVTLSTGERQIKFLNITVDHFNADMARTYEIIMENFADSQVYARLFIQGGSEYQEINTPDLDMFFDIGGIPESVVTNGIIILIGKSREAAGITIKPSFKLTATGRHQRLVGGVKYTVSGITDMMLKLPTNMESAEQLFGRASGWFDPQHHVHFWLPEAQIQDVYTGVIQTKRALVNSYNGQSGPESVLQIQNMCTSITHFSPNGNYRALSRRGHIAIRSDSKPALGVAGVGVELETDVFTLPDELYQAYIHVCSLPKRGKTVEGRTVHAAIKQIMTSRVGHTELLHISWDDARSKVILKSVAQPREGNRWRVNGYVAVVNNSLVLISFIKPWDRRPHFGYQCSSCALGPCNQHFDQSGTIYWNAGSTYQHASYARVMEHKYSEAIRNWHLCEKHQLALNRVNELVDSKEHRPKSLYHLFTRIHTLRGLNKQRPADMPHPTWISMRWQQFKSVHESLYHLLDTMVRAAPGKEDALIPDINRLMEPYFTPNKKLRPVLKKKKLTPKLKALSIKS